MHIRARGWLVAAEAMLSLRVCHDEGQKPSRGPAGARKRKRPQTVVVQLLAFGFTREPEAYAPAELR
jgi:hypothetical protein